MTAAGESEAVGVLEGSGCRNTVAAAITNTADAGYGEQRKSRPGAVAPGNAELLGEIADLARIRRKHRLMEAVHSRARFVENMRREGVVPTDERATGTRECGLSGINTK